MDIIALIKKKYGESCQLCPPLDEDRYDEAEKILPGELTDILKKSCGIKELMTLPGEEPFAVGYIVYSFDEIIWQTKLFRELFNEEGTVFSGNGAGGYYVIRPDGKIFFYEYTGEPGEYLADCLAGYFK